MHIDDWMDDLLYSGSSRHVDETLQAVLFFFTMKRMDALHQIYFKSIMNKIIVTCIYKGDKYRVTGCSRLGDIWLSGDYTRTIGYDLRVDVEECSGWEVTSELKEFTKNILNEYNATPDEWNHFYYFIL